MEQSNLISPPPTPTPHSTTSRSHSTHTHHNFSSSSSSTTTPSPSTSSHTTTQTSHPCKDPPKAPEASSGESRARIIREVRDQQSRGGNSKDLARRVQNIYSNAYEKRVQREERELVQERKREKHVVSYHPTLVDGKTGKRLLGCEHYARNCKIKAECCGVFVPCRLCHDNHDQCHHEIVRSDTKRVLCMLCDTEQEVGKDCKNCGVEFARYFCATCKLYDNTPGKDIYHCDKCKICRVGKGPDIDNIHCDNCDACILQADFHMHRCRARSTHANCSICSGYLHNSLATCRLTSCGHAIHHDCLVSYTQSGSYTCPICHKCLVDMSDHFRRIDEHLARERMPEEYQNKVSRIYCHDCERKTLAPYHFNYHKCGNRECGSYNTNVLEMMTK